MDSVAEITKPNYEEFKNIWEGDVGTFLKHQLKRQIKTQWELFVNSVVNNGFQTHNQVMAEMQILFLKMQSINQICAYSTDEIYGAV